MTPLVDVAFPLLAFFLCTTAISKPQTIDINIDKIARLSGQPPLDANKP